MRTYDFTPLSRSSIGFDRVFDLLNNSRPAESQDAWPPYDIARTGEEAYRITLALAGFHPDELSITAQQNLLTITGEPAASASREFLHQGIAIRPFEHKFSLEDHVEVAGASFANGLLEVDLVRRIPEAMKPRKIVIGQSGGTGIAGGKSARQIRAA